MRVNRLHIVAGMGLSLGALSMAEAQQDVAAPAKQPVDAKAKEVAERLMAHYAGLKSVSVRAVMKMTSKMEGETETMEQSLDFSMELPNKLSVRPRGDEADEYALVSDGKTFWQYYGSMFNKYEEKAAPDSLMGVVKAVGMGMDEMEEAGWMQPVLAPVLAMDSKSLKKLVGGDNAVKYIAREESKAGPVDRVRVTTAQYDLDLLVAAEGDAWLVSIVPDMKRMLEMVPEEFRDQMPKTELIFEEWKRAESLPAEAFAFKPPEGAQKVDSIMKAMQEEFERGGGEGGGADPHEALLGKPAPELELELLDGGKMSLAQHKGKDVVVLDFWATWCPPCVKGLPVVSKICHDMKDKGVVFYAVNQQEKVETIKSFLEKRELKLLVPLDKSGKGGNAFNVSGIPQTVLIGRDGTVQAVHVGFMPSMEAELKEQLETLVANKPLVTPKTDEAKPESADKPK